MPALPTPIVPVSWGELLDKVSILAIKRERLADPGALANVEREYRQLQAAASPALLGEAGASLIAQLRRVNEDLWDIEDAIRRHDAAQNFGDAFVALARSIYRRNDERASLKLRINHLFGSELIEEKSYPAFAEDAQATSLPLVPVQIDS